MHARSIIQGRFQLDCWTAQQCWQGHQWGRAWHISSWWTSPEELRCHIIAIAGQSYFTQYQSNSQLQTLLRQNTITEYHKQYLKWSSSFPTSLSHGNFTTTTEQKCPVFRPFFWITSWGEKKRKEKRASSTTQGGRRRTAATMGGLQVRKEERMWRWIGGWSDECMDLLAVLWMISSIYCGGRDECA